MPRAAGAPCPLLDGPASDPVRSAHLRLGGRLRRFETTSNDFSGEELQEIRARGQLYADVSSKLAPDDFERDLRKLVLAEECVGCPKRPRCGATWTKAPGNVFERDRLDVERVLGSLSGSVLDVGCGDGPYVRTIAARVATGDVSYVGVDPDVTRIRVLGSRYPWASYVDGDLPAFARTRDAAAPRFDHVLFLRSYNHLAAPEVTLALAVSLLAPGGTVLVVDNVAFGLVRGSEHAARAEAGPATFEHFRNDGLDDAVQVLTGLGLALVESRDVGPRTSNEWLAHYRKPAESSR